MTTYSKKEAISNEAIYNEEVLSREPSEYTMLQTSLCEEMQALEDAIELLNLNLEIVLMPELEIDDGSIGCAKSASCENYSTLGWNLYYATNRIKSIKNTVKNILSRLSV